MVKDRDEEQCIVFLYFHTPILPEAAPRSGLHKDSHKIHLEYSRGSSSGEETAWLCPAIPRQRGWRTSLLSQEGYLRGEVLPSSCL